MGLVRILEIKYCSLFQFFHIILSSGLVGPGQILCISSRVNISASRVGPRKVTRGQH